MRFIHAVLVLCLLAGTSLKAQDTSDRFTPPAPIKAAPMPAATQAPAVPSPKPRSQDWAQLTRFALENTTLSAASTAEPRVVFFGDSITDNWGKWGPPFFADKPYVNRGIGGQNTTQMLIRFEQDVVSLHPAVVVILGGTNDIAGGVSLNIPENNLASMITLAKENGIRVVLASLTPVSAYADFPDIRPIPLVRQLNTWISSTCTNQHLVYLDYYTALDDGNGAMKPGLSIEGLHPTLEGYALMRPLAEAAIQRALSN